MLVGAGGGAGGEITGRVKVLVDFVVVVVLVTGRDIFTRGGGYLF